MQKSLKKTATAAVAAGIIVGQGANMNVVFADEVDDAQKVVDTAKEELNKAQTEKDDADKALDKATTDLESAKEEVSKAEGKLDEAGKVLDEFTNADNKDKAETDVNNATSEVDNTKNELDKANTDVENKTDEVESKTDAKDEAKSDSDKANTELDKAQETLDNTSKDETNKADAKDEAETKKDEAETKKNDAKTELDNATTEKSDAEKDLVSKNETFDSATTEKSDAQKEYDDKKLENDTNKDAYDKAKDDYDKTLTEKETTDTELNNATTAKDNATLDHEEAKTDKDHAQKVYDAINDDEKKAQIVKDVEDAQKAVDTAKKNVTDAENALDEANKNLEDSNLDAEAKAKALEEANKKLEEAKTVLSEKESVLDTKKQELSSLETVRDDAQNKVNDAQKVVDNAKTEETNASNTVTNTENTITEKTNLVNTLTNGMDNLKNKVQAAMDKIAQGSLGFFQSIVDAGKGKHENKSQRATSSDEYKWVYDYETGKGHYESTGIKAGDIIENYDPVSSEQKAIDKLKREDTADKNTKLGAFDDATSLDNMKAAIETIIRMNELRSTDIDPETGEVRNYIYVDPQTGEEVDISNLRISSELMAYGQVRANLAKQEYQHYGSWENLMMYPQFNHDDNEVIEYGALGWYKKEKVVYDYCYKNWEEMGLKKPVYKQEEYKINEGTKYEETRYRDMLDENGNPIVDHYVRDLSKFDKTALTSEQKETMAAEFKVTHPDIDFTWGNDYDFQIGHYENLVGLGRMNNVTGAGFSTYTNDSKNSEFRASYVTQEFEDYGFREYDPKVGSIQKYDNNGSWDAKEYYNMFME